MIKNYSKDKKKLLPLVLLALGLALVSFIAGYAPARDFLFGSFASTPRSVNTSSLIDKTNLPITGTYIVPDLFYTSEAEYRSFFKELSETGIDTVVLTLTSELIKDCDTKAFKEDIDYRLYAGNPQFIPLAVKLSKEFGIKVYFSVAQFREEGTRRCFNFRTGTLGNEKTDKGRLIGYTMRVVDAIKTMVKSTAVSWSDPTIAGFYLFPEVDSKEFAVRNSPSLLFFKEISAQLKLKEPNKKILISPYQSEESRYNTYLVAYSNLMANTQIDIFAPQDSMGSGLTKTFTRSAEHFKALRDASLKYPGKEAWANIETFTRGENLVGNTVYAPSKFTKVKEQISSAKPYVTKMITWIYPQTMLMNPASDNKASENIYAVFYNPEYAIRRTSLRRDYLSAYGGVKWKITNVALKTAMIEISGEFGTTNSQAVVQLMYINTNGKVGRFNQNIVVLGGSQVVSIPRSQVPSMNFAKPFTAFVISSTQTIGTPSASSIPRATGTPRATTPPTGGVRPH